jgi:hypothetical protein
VKREVNTNAKDDDIRSKTISYRRKEDITSREQKEVKKGIKKSRCP